MTRTLQLEQWLYFVRFFRSLIYLGLVDPLTSSISLKKAHNRTL